MSPRIGSLFSGYGGLDMGVMAALGGSVAWHVEFDKAPSKILAHHWPDVPNYGDVTAVDWSSVEPVDIITGGSPCQDLSHAGRRQGMTEGTRSNLWVAMREAIAQLRPGLVVWENVRGAYSAAADSEVEPCAGCVGERPGVSLRALGRVLGDLSDLGYDCRWHGLRAADVGAPHGRFRVFVVAYASGNSRWIEHRDGALAAHADDHGRRLELAWGPGSEVSGPTDGAGAALLPTPAAYDGDRGGPQHPDKRKAGGHSVTLQDAVHGLLPTPSVADAMGGHMTRSGARSDELLLPGVAKALAENLLPTPRATDGTKGGPNQRGSSGDLMLPSAVTLLPTPRAHGQRTSRHAASTSYRRSAPSLEQAVELAEGITPREIEGIEAVQDSWRRTDWGIYADAIARWEALTRPAPAPTQPSKKGTPQLSPAFSEWLMGLPASHVTDVPGLSRNDMLKALGNGVVPQQAAAALRFLLATQDAAA